MSAVPGDRKPMGRGPRAWLSYQVYRARWSYIHDPSMACYCISAAIGLLLLTSYIIILLFAVIDSYGNPVWSTSFELSSRLQFPVVKVCGIGLLTPPPIHLNCAFYHSLGGAEVPTPACTPQRILPPVATGTTSQSSVGSCLAYNVDRTLWADSLETSLILTVRPEGPFPIVGVLADDRLRGEPGVTTSQITSSGLFQLFFIHPNERRFRKEPSRTYYSLTGGLGLDQQGTSPNSTLLLRFASKQNEVSTETVEFSVLVMLAAIGGVVSLYRAFRVCVRFVLRVWYFQEPPNKDEAVRKQSVSTLGTHGFRDTSTTDSPSPVIPIPELAHHRACSNHDSHIGGERNSNWEIKRMSEDL